MTADDPCNAQHGTTIRYPGHMMGTRAVVRCVLPLTHVAEDKAQKKFVDERLLAGKQALGVAGAFPVGAPVHADGAGYRWTDPEYREA